MPISRHALVAFASGIAAIAIVAWSSPDTSVPRALGGTNGRSSGGWQAAALDLPQAWGVTQGAPSVVVSIVDTGIAGGDPRFRDRVLPGYDFVHGQSTPVDDNGHGTALAGIVLSTCPRCSVLPVKVLNSSAEGDWGTVATGIIWATDHHADVIDLSVGASRAPDTLRSAVAYAIAKGVIVVAAAGNDGRSDAFYPASYPGVISVAAVDQTDARYSWSNFGSWVSVAAPGCTSTAWLGGGTVANFCGTSTAAPFVAGIAGLARSYDRALTPGDFAAALDTSGRPVTDAATASHGLIDANRLLVALGAPAGPPDLAQRPRVARTPIAGRSVAASAGTWRGAATTVIEWQRSRDGRVWHTVGTGRTYVPRAADIGFRLRVEVIATNVRGTTAVASPGTAPISGT